MNKLISIICPIFNEEGNINAFYEQLKAVIEIKAQSFAFEIIFVNDGSTDKSCKIINELCKHDKSLKHLEFSRNFGKELAVSAGLHYSTGDAAVIIDADLQHPPELIIEFIKKWMEGNDMVIGVRKKSKNESLCKRCGSWLFYKVMRLISETHISARETDFRLLDRIVINEFNRFTETNRITRGLIDWLGFKRAYIEFTANERFHGTASYSLPKLIKLALSSFVTHSLFPLKITGYLGVLIFFGAGFFGFFVVLNQYIFNSPIGFVLSGIAQMTVLVLFLVGIMLSSLGLIALYIGNIHAQVNNRPLYVVRKLKNFESNIKE